jgi:hypothetical protein
MNAQELQDMLADKIGRTEAMELIRFIKYRPDLATKHDIALLRKDMEALSKEIEHLAKVSVTEAQLEKAIGNLAWKVASVARPDF